MPPSARSSNVYLSEGGDQLLGAPASARYLGYHPVSFRRLVSRGEIRPHGRVGFALLFSRAELDRFKRSSPWAARKGGSRHLPNPPGRLGAEGAARAVVTVNKGRRSVLFKRLRPFRWGAVAALRQQLERKFGETPFRIVVHQPDGGRFEIDYRPPAAKSKNKGRGRADKRRDLWLVG